MMGRLNHDQDRLFYSFCLEEAVPDDHLVRKVAAVLDLSWVHAELAPHYPDNGRPSIDPELMVRMLVIGYVFAIRSERALCRDVQVNLAYRWFCGLSIDQICPLLKVNRPCHPAAVTSQFDPELPSGWSISLRSKNAHFETVGSIWRP
jgi:transposase